MFVPRMKINKNMYKYKTNKGPNNKIHRVFFWGGGGGGGKNNEISMIYKHILCILT